MQSHWPNLPLCRSLFYLELNHTMALGLLVLQKRSKHDEGWMWFCDILRIDLVKLSLQLRYTISVVPCQTFFDIFLNFIQGSKHQCICAQVIFDPSPVHVILGNPKIRMTRFFFTIWRVLVITDRGSVKKCGLQKVKTTYSIRKLLYCSKKLRTSGESSEASSRSPAILQV